MSKQNETQYPFLTTYLGVYRWQTRDTLLWLDKVDAERHQEKLDKGAAKIQAAFRKSLQKPVDG